MFMRLDHTLYALAVVFFIITLTSFILLSGASQLLWVIASASLGAISVGLGLIQKQKSRPAQQQTTVTTPTPVVEETAQTEPAQPIQTSIPIEASAEMPKAIAATEQPLETPVTSQVVNEPATQLPLTVVNGIGEKRASQLNALGITTVSGLAEASIKRVAKSLGVSPKIVAKWVADAKSLNKK
jgi:predicted flap endonuclease-1-like 5' DNA nuclease